MFGSSRNGTWLAWAAMVLYWMTSVGPERSRLVLCIGQDGHVAIEVARDEADCFDCVPGEAPVENSCTAPVNREQGLTACACTDIPLLASASESKSTARSQRETASDSLIRMLARADLLVPPALPRSLDFRSGAQPPPCPRAPALLTLRI